MHVHFVAGAFLTIFTIFIILLMSADHTIATDRTMALCRRRAKMYEKEFCKTRKTTTTAATTAHRLNK